MQLYNQLSVKNVVRLLHLLEKNASPFSFYQYHHINNPSLFRDYIFLHLNSLDVLGRIYVAKEGINAQLSVPAPRFNVFKTFLDEIDFLQGVRLNIAVEQDNESFLKLTIKVRDKIVADGLKGQHV